MSIAEDISNSSSKLSLAREVAGHFGSSQQLQELSRIDTGHINDTFLSVWSRPVQGGGLRLVHQRINHDVFRDVPALIQNVRLITEHLAKRLTPPECTLTLVPTSDGNWWVQTGEGSYWRTYRYIEGTEHFDVSPTTGHAEQVGRAFGRFLRLLSDFPSSALIDPIRGFQDAEGRISAFDAVRGSDPLGRLKEVRELCEVVDALRDKASLFAHGLRTGEVPQRVTHADPKVNNVLFVKGTTQVRGVVDLDTCMRGTSLFDFGDMVRSAGVAAREDEEDVTKMVLDAGLLKALSRGYLAEADTVLVDRERELLPRAPGVIALTLGVRFLTDYIDGDRYFRVHYPEHNKVRARAQLALAEWVFSNEAALSEVLQASA
jgi:Ser/Thr protein kinase RdoA (MazF antagonist)